MNLLLEICLVLHITGITILTGTTLVNYVISKQFWSNIRVDINRAIIINSTTLTLGRITAIGGMLTVLSGIAMVALFHGAFNSLLWFRLKMVILLLIIANSLFVERPLNFKLKTLLPGNANAVNELEAVKSKMNVYYLSQLTMLLIIFVLSIFRFN